MILINTENMENNLFVLFNLIHYFLLCCCVACRLERLMSVFWKKGFTILFQNVNFSAIQGKQDQSSLEIGCWFDPNAWTANHIS